MEPITFELMLNSVPYWVKAVPFTFNSEARYRVSYNDRPEYIFAWDTGVEQFVSIGDESSTIPDDVEEAIGCSLRNCLWPLPAHLSIAAQTHSGRRFPGTLSCMFWCG